VFPGPLPSPSSCSGLATTSPSKPPLITPATGQTERETRGQAGLVSLQSIPSMTAKNPMYPKCVRAPQHTPEGSPPTPAFHSPQHGPPTALTVGLL
jgi:hypothetical protein